MSKRKALTPSEILQRDAASAWSNINTVTTAKTLLIGEKIFKVDENGVLIFTISKASYEKSKTRIDAFFNTFKPKSDSQAYRKEVKEDDDNITYCFYHPTMYKAPDQWDLSQAAVAIVENLALNSGSEEYNYYSNLNPKPTIRANLNNNTITIRVSNLSNTTDHPLKLYLKHNFKTLTDELAFNSETRTTLTEVQFSKCEDSQDLPNAIFISFTLHSQASVEAFIQHVQSQIGPKNITLMEEIKVDSENRANLPLPPATSTDDSNFDLAAELDKMLTTTDSLLNKQKTKEQETTQQDDLDALLKSIENQEHNSTNAQQEKEREQAHTIFAPLSIENVSSINEIIIAYNHTVTNVCPLVQAIEVNNQNKNLYVTFKSTLPAEVLDIFDSQDLTEGNTKWNSGVGRFDNLLLIFNKIFQPKTVVVPPASSPIRRTGSTPVITSGSISHNGFGGLPAPEGDSPAVSPIPKNSSSVVSEIPSDPSPAPAPAPSPTTSRLRPNLGDTPQDTSGLLGADAGLEATFNELLKDNQLLDVQVSEYNEEQDKKDIKYTRISYTLASDSRDSLNFVSRMLSNQRKALKIRSLETKFESNGNLTVSYKTSHLTKYKAAYKDLPQTYTADKDVGKEPSKELRAQERIQSVSASAEEPTSTDPNGDNHRSLTSDTPFDIRLDGKKMIINALTQSFFNNTLQSFPYYIDNFFDENNGGTTLTSNDNVKIELNDGFSWSELIENLSGRLRTENIDCYNTLLEAMQAAISKLESQIIEQADEKLANISIEKDKPNSMFITSISKDLAVYSTLILPGLMKDKTQDNVKVCMDNRSEALTLHLSIEPSYTWAKAAEKVQDIYNENDKPNQRGFLALVYKNMVSDNRLQTLTSVPGRKISDEDSLDSLLWFLENPTPPYAYTPIARTTTEIGLENTEQEIIKGFTAGDRNLEHNFNIFYVLSDVDQSGKRINVKNIDETQKTVVNDYIDHKLVQVTKNGLLKKKSAPTQFNNIAFLVLQQPTEAATKPLNGIKEALLKQLHDYNKMAKKRKVAPVHLYERLPSSTSNACQLILAVPADGKLYINHAVNQVVNKATMLEFLQDLFIGHSVYKLGGAAPLNRSSLSASGQRSEPTQDSTMQSSSKSDGDDSSLKASNDGSRQSSDSSKKPDPQPQPLKYRPPKESSQQTPQTPKASKRSTKLEKKGAASVDILDQFVLQ